MIDSCGICGHLNLVRIGKLRRTRSDGLVYEDLMLACEKCGEEYCDKEKEAEAALKMRRKEREYLGRLGLPDIAPVD